MITQRHQGIFSPTLHLSIVLSITIFVAILSASFVIKIEIVAQGVGKVIPADKVQVVQSEFNGKVKSIFVKNGERVNKDQLLIELDGTEASAQLNTVNEEIRRLEIERYRIDNLMIVFSNTETKDDISSFNASLTLTSIPAATSTQTQPGSHTFDQPYLLDQHSLLGSEIEEFRNSLSIYSAQLEANKNSQSVTEANIDRIDALLKIHVERHQAATKLSARGTISRADYLNTIENLTNLEEQRNIYSQELAQKLSVTRTLLAERKKYRSGLRAKHFSRKSAIEGRIERLLQDKKTRQRELINMNLRAPVDGIVDKLDIHTIGGVILSGSKTMHIVPYDSTPVLEVMVANENIGFVKAGQLANIKLSAFPSERFGHVKGKVTNISADATEISSNNWGFSIRIEPESNYLEAGNIKHRLRPGMTAHVDIITGSRTLISYFFAPILRTIQESMGER